MYTISSILFPHAPLYLVCKKEKRTSKFQKEPTGPGKKLSGPPYCPKKKLSEGLYRVVVGVL
jgi:hypothetical protein